MNLFKVIYGVFRGPYIFSTLSEFSFGKVFRQLFCVVALCSVLVYIGQYSFLILRWRKTEAKFVASFGYGLKFTDRGIIPENDPHVSRSLELPYSGMLLYATAKDPQEYDDRQLENKNFILLWSSAGFALAMRQEDKWLFLHIDPEVNVEFKPEATDFQGMKRKLVAASAMPDSKMWYFTENLDYLTVPVFFDKVRFYMALVQTISFFSSTLLITLLGTGIFALFFGCSRLLLRWKKQLKEKDLLPVGKVWKCGIYAAFPVIFVVSFFPAFQLMKPNYFYLCVFCGWSIYMMFILHLLYNENKNADAETAETEKTDQPEL